MNKNVACVVYAGHVTSTPVMFADGLHHLVAQDGCFCVLLESCGQKKKTHPISNIFGHCIKHKQEENIKICKIHKPTVYSQLYLKTYLIFKLRNLTI